MTSKYWENNYDHLDKSIDFPRVNYSRSLQAKVNGRWQTIFNFILTNGSTAGRKGVALSQWPEFEIVCAEFKNASKFRITNTDSILPLYFLR